MTKIVLVFNLLLTFLFSFSNFNLNEPSYDTNLLNMNNNTCEKYDSIVNITTTNNLINVSGFVVTGRDNYVFIVTSYLNYNRGYNYEVIFSNYTRLKATVIGIAKEDQIMILSVQTPNNYCRVNYSRSELIDKGEEVEILGAHNYKPAMAMANVSEVGVCANCNEETYKKYYYSLLSVDIDDYLIGAGVFDKRGQLLGIITSRNEKYNMGVTMLDVNKLVIVSYQLINNGTYDKNYIKYNLLNVNSLTNHEKYLYSLDEELTKGVLVSSIHYFNYFIGGLNQGMVIYKVNGIDVENCYEFDNELAKYEKGTYVYLSVKTITNKDKVYRVKV